MTNKNPCTVIKIDKRTGKIERPTLLLKTKTYEEIGSIGHYEDWHISMNANAVDEISFTVHKYVNNVKCPVWDDLVDLKTVEVVGYGMFEIHVSLDEETECIKTVTGQSMEVELGQIPLRNFHVNDDEAMTMVQTEYNKGDFDKNGNFIPTTFYNENDVKHSLLDRALADKSCHWKIGNVTPYVTKGENEVAEESCLFQRTYTVDGTTIYDFLTGEVAEETNVIFEFDTYNRTINVYSIYDCYKKDGTLLVDSIGDDTSILISRNKLAKQVSIESNTDELKNCFYVTGGDDLITNYVAAVNLSGDNYIYQFSPFQLNDMPQELVDKLESYSTYLSSREEEYYGENGIFTLLCKAYDDLYELESEMMPKAELDNDVTANKVFTSVCDELLTTTIGVYLESIYNNEYYSGITNNVESFAEVITDVRYDIEIVKGSYVGDDGITHNTPSYDTSTKKWTGVFKFTRATDENDTYPTNSDIKELVDNYSITLNVAEDNDLTGQIPYTEQKIYKALKTATVSDENFKVETMTDREMYDYFSKFCLNRLKAFSSGYNACISVLCEVNKASTDEVTVDIYESYKKRLNTVNEILTLRQEQVDNIRDVVIEDLLKRQSTFHEECNLRNWLGEELFTIFSSYRREYEYNNSNYISDSLMSDSEIIQKAKDLLEVAKKELKKSCMLQRTVSTSTNNLFLLPEFEPMYKNFALFNYIRVKTDDELFKLRIVGIEFGDSDLTDIQVTFSENIVSLGSEIDNTVNDVESLLSQVGSIATSYSSTVKQAEQGVKANNIFNEIYYGGLNAANMMIKNSNNNEMTMTQAGIIGKVITDEGVYSGEQIRLTGNVLGFTTNDWKTSSLALGKIQVTDPISGERSMQYGLIAEAVIGKLIASEKMWIGNSDNNVIITSDGIGIDGGYISLKSNKLNDLRSVIIDPQERTDSGVLLQVTDKNGNVTIGADSDGNASFSGAISSSSFNGGDINIGNSNFIVNSDGSIVSKSSASFANGNFTYDTTNGLIITGKINAQSGGTIGGFNIGSSSIYSGTNSIDSTTAGVYLGTNGIRQYKDANHYVSMSNGVLTATGVSITGIIHASSGTFSGNITANGTITGGTISGATINGATINGSTITSSGSDDLTTIKNGSITSNRIYLQEPSGAGFVPTIYLLNSSGSIVNAISLSSDRIELDTTTLINGSLWCTSVDVDNSVDATTIKTEAVALTTESVRPTNDYKELATCGTSSHKWATIYAKNGTVQTSDRNQKRDFKKFDELYEKLFLLFKPLRFHFINGDREHWGFISQDLEESMRQLGLTDLDVAAFCKDLKTKEIIDDDGIIKQIPDLDENGNEQYIYSIRYSEFIAINTYMIQKLYEENNSLKSEILEIKQSLQSMKEVSQ